MQLSNVKNKFQYFLLMVDTAAYES